ncbi:phosphonate C-P lyase system protein PhnG [Pectobacterium brasiliense]|uniref:Phosphonate C-P lyase system protein PhnG n=1 Tax=Pectobacterium brasiliense TaxID=180957 RepID=A0A433NIJ1_9GAMM|nr:MULTISPECIES: phosphonate C-P lyase system protein PhnG [Pectobacterium]GKV77506.1 phosphonate C-P lyase system protein PhnG [Pectobacterium carotovorum subsp. carotovorum]AFR01907.1 putative phosphonate metabolism protein [Pectobacterium carotovorum subsp. carotovorum PCC21]KFF68377.1 phosphonate C-P lyase [Pectobacterium brasiliense]KFF70975.1 phosphonate C-P lyase [Pectobacterium brasiliense]KHS70051.1 phosphonate C-P lyase [Pectobacterium brasiliense]
MSELTQRQRWMSILAHSDPAALEAHWDTLHFPTDYQLLRPTQIGLIQLQGRMEVDGPRFIVGDMTVTRAAVQLEDGTCGYSYIAGRNKPHAELCAWIDALLQTRSSFHEIWERIITPLADQQRARREQQQHDVAASRVNFFTLVRGE